MGTSVLKVLINFKVSGSKNFTPSCPQAANKE